MCFSIVCMLAVVGVCVRVFLRNFELKWRRGWKERHGAVEDKYRNPREKIGSHQFLLLCA